MRRERTVEYGLMGDANGNTRLPGTDLVIFRLVSGTGRPQIARLSRLETGEVTYNATTQVYTNTAAAAPVANQAILVQRTGGRAPSGWQVVSIAPGA